jgi:propanediol dehydratase small subunit
MLSMLAIIALVVALGLGMLVFNRTTELYGGRRCMGKLWRKEFPDSPKEDIRRFLWFFASAFAIPRRQALLLMPDDELMAIYRARYPVGGGVDALEFETLARQLQKVHHLTLEHLWHEGLTVGKLFAKLRESSVKRGD